MNKQATSCIIIVLYLGVMTATLLEPGNQSQATACALFLLGAGFSLALSLLMIFRRGQGCWILDHAYVIVQVLLFYLLHLLPISLSLLWLLAMPCLSQAAFFLPWPGIAAATVAYMGIFLWTSHGYARGEGEWVRISMQYGAAILFTLIFTRMTHQAVLAKEEARGLAGQLEKANALLREGVERDRTHAAMTERTRIARDIHDGLGHCLTTIAVQLEAARTLLAKSPMEADATLVKAQQQAREALDEVRRSVRTLRTEGPAPDLRDTIAGLINESGLSASLEVRGDHRTLGAEKTQALFRVAQEALTNVRKHAEATTTTVLLHYHPDHTEIVVTDTGRGAKDGRTGYGLAGLGERLEAIGGRLQTGNRPEGGFQLRAEVPL